MAPRMRVIEGGLKDVDGLRFAPPAAPFFDEQLVGITADGTPSGQLARDMAVSLETARSFEQKGRQVAQALSAVSPSAAYCGLPACWRGWAGSPPWC
jgi:hypothetical protein